MIHGHDMTVMACSRTFLFKLQPLPWCRAFCMLALIVWAADTVDSQVFKNKQASQTLRAKVGTVLLALRGQEGEIQAKSLTTWASGFLTGNVAIVVTGWFMAQRRREDGL